MMFVLSITKDHASAAHFGTPSMERLFYQLNDVHKYELVAIGQFCTCNYFTRTTDRNLF